MPRRPDNPEDQRAKGFPGKRRTKVERLIEEAEQRAKRLAASPSESHDILAPPALIDDPKLADALWIWRRYAPQLHEQNLFGDLDRLTFAMYCVYQAEFFLADEDIRKNGYSFMVAATAGGRRPWENPAVARRETAGKMALELSKRFGLTPLDRSTLEKIHSLRDAGPLFRRNDDEAPEGPENRQEAVEDDPIGVLDRLDGPPPNQRPN